MKQISFRELKENDFFEIKKIYDFYIENTTATFHIQKQSVKQLKQFILIDHPKYKSFIIKDKEETVGYCYFAAYKTREAFDRCAEISIYLKNDCTHKKIGEKALQYLEEVASLQNIKVLLAVITGENLQSIKFFKKAGYKPCGFFEGVGEKFGKVLDLFICQKFL